MEQAGLDFRERLFARLGGFDLVTFLAEKSLERDKNPAFVIHDQQAALHRRSPACARSGVVAEAPSIAAVSRAEGRSGADAPAGCSVSPSLSTLRAWSRAASASGIVNLNSVPTPGLLCT